MRKDIEKAITYKPKMGKNDISNLSPVKQTKLRILTEKYEKKMKLKAKNKKKGKINK